MSTFDIVDNQIASALHGKHVLVTGGTGSFGNHIINELIRLQAEQIIVMSRDEKKQYDMQHLYQEHQNLRFVLGDVRDFERLREVLKGVNIVFHAAALKQVPHCEYAPMEAIKTNVIGAENVRRSAIESGVDVVIAISTDKAVKPVNVMGMSKALQERIMIHPDPIPHHTRFVCVRYGNVLGSRGSVVPLFHQKILDGKPLTITHSEMTRFLLTLKTAVQLVFTAMVEGANGELWVRKMPSSKVTDLARVLAYGMTGKNDYPQEVKGIRPGEKIHEVLVSEEEMVRAIEMDQHFRIPSWVGPDNIQASTQDGIREYASNNVGLLSDEEIYKLLESEGWFERNGK